MQWSGEGGWIRRKGRWKEDHPWPEDGHGKVREHSSQLLSSGLALLLDGNLELAGTQLRCAVANLVETGVQLRSAEPKMEM